MQRNSGFTFEPGYFSFFINIGILICFVKNRFKFSSRIILYIITLITTMSTTGFIGFALILLILYLNSKGSKKFKIIPFIILIIIFFINSSIGINKIETLMLDRQSVDDLVNQSSYKAISMGRFSGFEYYFKLVLNENPLFGLSLIGFKEDVNIGVANGIAHFIRNLDRKSVV